MSNALDGLQEHFHTLVVSYSGFDDTENSTFISELDEVLKVENYIKDKLDGSCLQRTAVPSEVHLSLS